MAVAVVRAGEGLAPGSGQQPHAGAGGDLQRSGIAALQPSAGTLEWTYKGYSRSPMNWWTLSRRAWEPGCWRRATMLICTGGADGYNHGWFRRGPGRGAGRLRDTSPGQGVR